MVSSPSNNKYHALVRAVKFASKGTPDREEWTAAGLTLLLYGKTQSGPVEDSHRYHSVPRSWVNSRAACFIHHVYT